MLAAGRRRVVVVKESDCRVEERLPALRDLQGIVHPRGEGLQLTNHGHGQFEGNALLLHVREQLADKGGTPVRAVFINGTRRACVMGAG